MRSLSFTMRALRSSLVTLSLLCVGLCVAVASTNADEAPVERTTSLHEWVATISDITRSAISALPIDTTARGVLKSVDAAAALTLGQGSMKGAPSNGANSATQKQGAPRVSDKTQSILAQFRGLLHRVVDGARRWYAGGGRTAPVTSRRAAAGGSTKASELVDLWRSNSELIALHRAAAEEYGRLKRREGDLTAMPTADTPTFRDTYFLGDLSEEQDEAHHRVKRYLTGLLRWRRAQRNVRRPPSLGPDRVPRYARDLAARLHRELRSTTYRPDVLVRSAAPNNGGGMSKTDGGHQRRVFRAESISSGFSEPQYSYCEDGLTVIPSSVNFTCNTTDGSQQNFTAANFSQLGPAERANCTPQSTQRACLCALDSVIALTITGDVACYWRDITCSVTALSPLPCVTQPVDQPLEISQCTTINRFGGVATFSVNVTCRFLPLQDVDYAYFGVTLIPPPNGTEQFLVLNTSNASEPIFQNITDAPTLPFGTAQQLMEQVFIYAVEPVTSPMPLTAAHNAVGTYMFFARPVSFVYPSDMTPLQYFLLGEAGYQQGQVTGEVPVVMSLNFSNVSDNFITANRAFVEVGLSGGAASLYPYAVMAPQWTVDFDDLVTPPVIDRNPSDTTTIIIAVVVPVGCLSVFGVVVGIYCRRRRAQKQREKAEDQVLE